MHPTLLSLLGIVLSLGCAAPKPVNPAFAISPGEASRVLDDMKHQPKRLTRPVLVIDGYGDPGLGSAVVRNEIVEATGDERVITVSCATCDTFDECRKRVIAAVDHAYPTANDKLTTEVDVIGISMGGLVARYSAEPPAGKGKRLRIARLFTLSSPLRGAKAAALPTFNQLQIDMRIGSPFMKKVNDVKPDYPIYPYVRLGDPIVGPANASPPGENPIWVANLALQPAHIFAVVDPRIIGDISRRLRAEEPLSKDQRAPLPL
jgi:hypothetical protein